MPSAIDATNRATQLAIVASRFRERGRVSAHEMLVEHGITRLAAIIHTLRHTFHWAIETEPREPGYMANYRLTSEPDTYALVYPPRRSRRWLCATCSTPVARGRDVAEVTNTLARGECSKCGTIRMFRRGGA